MITGTHAIVHAEDPQAARAFFRDVLRMPTVSELRRNGVDFSGSIEDQAFGRIVRLKVPGAGEVGLYEPRHATAHDLEG